jgi:hypothetical protein
MTFLISEDAETVAFPAKIHEIPGENSFAPGAAQWLSLKLPSAGRAFLQCPNGSGHAEIIGKGTFQVQPFSSKAPT